MARWCLPLQQAIAAAIAAPTESSVAAPHAPFGAIVNTVVGAVSKSGWATAEQRSPIARVRTHATLRKRYRFIAPAPLSGLSPVSAMAAAATRNAVGPLALKCPRCPSRREPRPCVRVTQKCINGHVRLERPALLPRPRPPPPHARRPP